MPRSSSGAARRSGGRTMTVGIWAPLWPLVQPRIEAAQPKRTLPKPNKDGWIGPIFSPLRTEVHPSFSVLPDSPTEPGAYKDHATGEKGPMAKLAEQLRVDPRVSATEAPPQGEQTLAEFCRVRKLDRRRLVEEWGVREV